MTYVVTEACIKCKYMDCVEVCPVDCFYEGENMLVIHPDECIDCGVCEPECPPEAIVPDTDPQAEAWLEHGIIMRLRGNDKGARAAWLQVLLLDPDGPAGDVARANIERMELKLDDKPAAAGRASPPRRR